MEKTVRPLTGKRVFLYMVLFFGVVTAVNIFFVTKAIQTNTGVVTDKPYERGLAYNDVLAEAEKEKALGWQGDLSIVDDAKFLYILKDKDGKPVDGAKISVEMRRPAQVGYDYTAALVEEAPSHYSAPLNAPLKGAWEAHLTTIKGNDRYHQSVPLVLK